MYLTVKQQLKHLSKEEYLSLKELSHTAKNLYNQAVYNIRQYYFQENKYLNYQKNNFLLKSSENYKTLNSNMSQQILKEVDGSFKSFFNLLKRKIKECIMLKLNFLIIFLRIVLLLLLLVLLDLMKIHL